MNRIIIVQHFLKRRRTTYYGVDKDIFATLSINFLRFVFITILALLLYIAVIGIFYIAIYIVTSQNL